MRVTLQILLLVFTIIHANELIAQAPNEAEPTQVISQSLSFEAQKLEMEAVGTAEAVKSVNIYPAAADKVVAVNFRPGQKVNIGEVLIELDARRQRTALERAKIQLQDAQRTLQRLQQSKQQGAVTQSALDDASTAMALFKVAVADAESDLEDRFVKAPFAGVVGLTDVEVGDRINMATLVTTIDSREQLYINFKAPESALPLLRNDSEVKLQPWTNRQISLPAQISQLDSRVSELDRTIRVRAILDNDKDTYRPGMSFRVSLSLAGERFAVIPESGLSWGATGAYIWLVEQGKAKKVAVDIRQRLQGKILVSGALEEGDELIVEGIQRLREGEVVDAQAQMRLS